MLLAALSVASSWTLSEVKADTTAYVEGGTETDSGGGYGGGAFDFTVNASINVTQLGFYALSIGGGDTRISISGT